MTRSTTTLNPVSHHTRSVHVLKSLTFAIAVLTTSPALASAAISPHDFALGAGIGTAGIGGQLTTQLIPHRLNLNVGISRFTHSFHFTTDNTNFGSNLRLGGEPIVLSFYPFGGNFNIDAGAVINANRATVTGEPNANATYTINGDTYTAAEVGSLRGATHFNTVAPYVGVGWGQPFEGGRWSFLINAGAMYEGSPHVSLAASGASSNPKLASDVKAEQSKVNSHLNFLNWWPVITVGVSYRF
jgi:hypothetical protein